MHGPAWRAIAAQIGALVLLAAAFKLGFIWGWKLSPFELAWLAGGLAFCIGLLLRLPWWWWPIQLLFPPALYWSLALPPWLGLAAFVLLWLWFRANPRERVPLYLSNRATWAAVAELLPEDRPFRFIDLGCGLGGGLQYLSGRFPLGKFHGIEAAPLPFLCAWLRLRGKSNAVVGMGNFWEEDLGRYDWVYAFLSPEPMPALWRKVVAEMREGANFISNSFEAPGAIPDRSLELDDGRRSRLLLWRIG